jgi:hypothetical protein
MLSRNLHAGVHGGFRNYRKPSRTPARTVPEKRLTIAMPLLGLMLKLIVDGFSIGLEYFIYLGE